MGKLSPEEWRALREEAVARLGRGAPRDDVILDICRTAGIRWEEAEEFLAHLEVVDAPRIHRRKSFLLLLVSVAFLLQNLVTVQPVFSVVFAGLEILADGITPSKWRVFMGFMRQHWFLLALWLLVNIGGLIGLGQAIAGILKPDVVSNDVLTG